MKKFIALLLTAVMMLSMAGTAFAQEYKTGYVYVEGSTHAYADGDTITVEKGKTIHVARYADGMPPIEEGDFWYSCWNPFGMDVLGFKFYGKNGEDGAAFKGNDSLWGPFISTEKAKPGKYRLHFYFASAKDVAENDFAAAKEYEPINVYLKVTKGSQKLSVSTAKKTVKAASLKKKSVTVAPIKKVKGAKTSLSYSKTSGSKKLKVNAKTGKITVKKGTKKGTYTAKIKVTAKSTSSYKKAAKTVKVTVKVK